MYIQYNLYNKQTGIVATFKDSKILLEKYLSLGYTLISAIWKE